MTTATDTAATETVLSLTARLEAVLFVSGDPVRLAKLAAATGTDADTVSAALADLQAAYVHDGRGLAIVRNGDTAQLATAPDAQAAIDAYADATLHEDLSRASLEVLAIVAYRSPVSRAEIEAIRGVNCSFSIRNLLLRGLIDRVPDPARRRAYLYRVTNDFLTHLGITSSSALPDFAELAQHPSILQATGEAVDEADDTASDTDDR